MRLPEGWTRKRKGDAKIYIREGLDHAVVDSPWSGIYYNGKHYANLPDAMYQAEQEVPNGRTNLA